jgi:hypothetical protein
MNEPPPSFTGEVMLAGWQETHNGGAKVTFWLPSSEDLEPFRMATVRKGKTAGQRYMCVLVEIGDDEKPMRHPSNDAHLLLTGDDFLAYAKAHATRAGMRDAWDGAAAKEWAKYVIGCESLSQLDKDPALLARYHELVLKPFQRWNGTGGEDNGDDDLGDRGSLDEPEPD